MSDDRITQLEIENARLAVSLEHLTESVRELTKTVQDLRDTMNRGRGALWVVVGASSLLGAVMASLISKLFANGS